MQLTGNTLWRNKGIDFEILPRLIKRSRNMRNLRIAELHFVLFMDFVFFQYFLDGF